MTMTAPAPTAGAEALEKTTNKVTIMMFSGTADKFLPLGVITQSAAAMGMQVQVFVTGFALNAFTKEHHDLPFPVEFAAMAPALHEGLQSHNVPSWDAMLRQAKKMGAKVYACSMMCDVMGLGKDDFNDLVDDLVGAATLVEMAQDAETFFI